MKENEFRKAVAIGAVREVVAVGASDGFYIKSVLRDGSEELLESRRRVARRFASLQTLAGYLRGEGIRQWRVDASQWEPRQKVLQHG